MASGTRAEKLAEYNEASEEARYRDRLLYGTYYLTLIFFGVLIKLSFSAYDAENYALLSALSLFGSYSFFLLAAWSYFVRHARDAAWQRRERLESDLNFRLNEQITTEIENSCNHEDRLFGGLFCWMREHNCTDLIEMILLPLSGVWLVIAAYVALVEWLEVSLSSTSFLGSIPLFPRICCVVPF